MGGDKQQQLQNVDFNLDMKIDATKAKTWCKDFCFYFGVFILSFVFLNCVLSFLFLLLEECDVFFAYNYGGSKVILLQSMKCVVLGADVIED